MKIVFPILIVTFVAASSAARAESVDCNDFPDFRARVTCYDVTSRGPRAEEAKTLPPATMVKTKRPRHARRHVLPSNILE